MRPPRPLPQTLAERPFPVAKALELGISPDRLRARDLDAAIHGARMPREAGLDTRCLALLLVCRSDAVICGPTAALLHGLPMPMRFAAATPLHVAVPPHAPAVRRAGVVGHRLSIDEEDVTIVREIVLTRLARTWCDLAACLTVPELVAAADSALRSRSTDADALRTAVEAYPDFRRRQMLRTALELADAASESPKESELRAIVILAGLPHPEANVVIRRHDGRVVARVDLLFRSYGEVLEYHGDYHRTDQRQWRRDRTREAELESLGYHVMEVTEHDLRRPHELVGRIARNLARRGWTGTVTHARGNGASHRR
ncbi:hypothetical protein BCL57_000822 [Agromyces flavus]|uniref:DUF559 domain-containing protein n=1 Tax=Agromyces flavus TaxID=589382 RepID=A0A1H1YG17_9MICO|nr:hypothetical protein [Agromyces flavus]MCP2366680.1 hypothetical protein [Agromyces flavus]GGI45160.1 hypothetical protein GCM10010932_08230 [Agromyces flavus]SDT20383.1 hypothetical protein SAMN04489721_2755 [Agromyces flavus]